MKLAMAVAAVCLSLPVPSVQPARDISGHWDGSIAAPDMDLSMAVDVTRNSSGELAGTISIPAQGLQDVPLKNVSLDGSAVRFVLETESGGGPFDGDLSSDGRMIAGNFVTRGQAVHFSMTLARNRSSADDRMIRRSRSG
jgi:hypothetical protein